MLSHPGHAEGHSQQEQKGRQDISQEVPENPPRATLKIEILHMDIHTCVLLSRVLLSTASIIYFS